MPELYEIDYDIRVEDDFATLDRAARRRVMDAVDLRLGSSPEKYGRPLGGRFAGLRRLRVGDVRIVYRVVGRKVVVLAALTRRDVYEVLDRRL